jgi:regulator of protease activity HflC (stomatin/prohibitin superfamily)
MLSESPRFNAARRYGWVLGLIGTVFAVLGLVLIVLALMRARESSSTIFLVPRALGYLGAALWTAAGAFLSAATMSFARQRYLTAEIAARGLTAPVAPVTEAAVVPRALNWRSLALELESRVRFWARDPGSTARWPPVLIAMLFAIMALISAIALWRAPAQSAFDALTLKLIAAGLGVAAFPLLVLERQYASQGADLLPEAAQLERLLRLPLAACLLLAIELILMSVGVAWANQIEHLVGLLIAVVSLELLLRCATVLFVPFAPIERRQSLADSRIAGAVLRLSLPSIKTFNIVVRRQLGIDLSRSWALGFIQKAALPVFVGMGVFAWGITGVTVLNIDQRGIYERLGLPVAVFGPGIHLHLPWPLGTTRPVEIGVVHLLPIEFLLPGGAEAEKSSSVGADESKQPVAAEALAPEDADRLWTDNHPFEGNYLIASEENGRQSFQLVDIDMAVMYRVGLSEEAARNAAYRVTDIDELIQALSGQLLVRYFTHNTLLDLLGKSRETFTRDFQTSLQEQLDRFSTGVEAIGVSVEAIHPPPGAAKAYHDVQAAEIAATTQISLQRGEAARTLNSAQQRARANLNEALASSAERLGQAQSQSVLFAGDRQAYAQDGYAFLFERWLDDLTRSLAQSPFVLIDHRLPAQNMPALDLRYLGGSISNAALASPPPSNPSSTRGDEEQ